MLKMPVGRSEAGWARESAESSGRAGRLINAKEVIWRYPLKRNRPNIDMAGKNLEEGLFKDLKARVRISKFDRLVQINSNYKNAGPKIPLLFLLSDIGTG